MKLPNISSSSTHTISSLKPSEYDRAINYLKKVPPAISWQRGHDRTISLVGRLKTNFPNLTNEQYLTALMEDWNRRCTPPWSAHELIHKIQDSKPLVIINKGGNNHMSHLKQSHHFSAHRKTGSRSIMIDEEKIRNALYQVSDELLEFQLNDTNHLKGSFSHISPNFFLERLFLHDENIAILFRDFKEVFICSLAEWKRHPSSIWKKSNLFRNLNLLCPNPMKYPGGPENIPYNHELRKQKGFKEGGISFRCNANVAKRRYYIVEFDPPKTGSMARLLHYPSTRNQQKLLFFLSQFVPLDIIVYSGKKSLHGWFNVEGLSDNQFNQFCAIANSLGADKAMTVPCQPTRLPNGMRGEHRQNVVYANKHFIERRPP